MAVIYKYPLPSAAEPFEIKIRGLCEIVHAGLDGNGVPCLWAMVVPAHGEESWRYLIVGTGQEFDTSKWGHLKTFMQGQLVWHLLIATDGTV